MSNLLESYNKILALLHTLDEKDNYRQQVRPPKMTDKQLIALCLAAESQGIDSERYLFRQLPSELLVIIERSVYNRRRRALSPKIEDFRQAMSHAIVPVETYHVVDSMPLEICRFSRAARSRICQSEVETAPDYGYCAAHKMHYFGYKLHAVCTVQGVLRNVGITKASCHDIHYINDIRDDLNACVLIGDKGYLSQTLQLDLFDNHGLKLNTPMRKNQQDYKPFPQAFSKVRKRIETLFSQLCDQFMIRRNYAKSFEGFSARIISKVAALTLIQWINHQAGREINHLKIMI
jgi:hypothetical protein